MSWDFLVIVQCLMAALSSGFNALYFLSYRSPRRSRQVAAAAMALVSFSTLAENLYSGVLFFSRGASGLAGLYLYPVVSVTVRTLVLMGTAFITMLIVRKMWDE